jgi:hypothetical protein
VNQPTADRTTQTQTPTKTADQDKEKKQTTAENKTADQTKEQTANQNQAQVTPTPPPPERQIQQPPAKNTDRVAATTPIPPATETPSQPSAKLEVHPKSDALTAFNLPEVTPLDTFGGQLLASYLNGEISGEQVISQVFGNKALAISNLAEMSAAVWTLRQSHQYNEQDQAKVLVLEGAMTRFLNEELRSSQTISAALEYGTAITLGAVGGYYSEEILRALARFGNTPIVQLPWNGVKSSARYVGLKTRPVTNWFRNRWSGSAPVTTASAEETSSRSSDMFRRTIGFMNSPASAEDRQLTVFHNIYRVLNSPQLAKGYRVDPVANNLMDFAKRQDYFRTGIPGFQISQPPGKDYLLAQLVSRGGEYEYYRVTGVAIKAVTKEGKETVVPPEALTGTIYSRLRSWGDRTADSLSTYASRGYNGVKNSKPVRYMTTDPMGRRIGQGVLVGAPISAMTLLALRPIDTSYVTLDGYLRELQSEGLQVDLNHFTDSQRQKALSGR